MTPNDYQSLFETAILTKDAGKLYELNAICTRAIDSASIYKGVGSLVDIPWVVIACIHYRESSQNFHCHLHNGDSLQNRTVNVPKGRPVYGKPPFSWAESAMDALSEVWMPNDWSVPSCLEFMERYNGLGYYKRGLNTPYLWNYTDKYRSGLFVADGQFDNLKIEHRPGCVAIMKSLALKGVSLDFQDVTPRYRPLH